MLSSTFSHAEHRVTMSDTDGRSLSTRGQAPISQWARTQRELLRLERDEEKSQVVDTIAQLPAQECMERGISLLPLAVTGLSTGLYGRACVNVGDPKGRPLPSHRLGAGDQVRLYSSKGSHGGDDGVSEISGVVGKVTEVGVEVISDDADEAGALRAPLRLDVVASEATHKKLMMGLDALEKYPGGGPAERVIDVLFGSQPPSAAGTARIPAIPSPGPGAPASVMAKLNDSQRDAVAFALATRDVALIHGPPGTGKTTTVVALVLEAVARGWRCLVCAPSNVAVDGILERLVAVEDEATTGSSGRGGGSRKSQRPRVVRMGHPARLLPKVLEHSLEALVSRHEGTAIVKDVRGEIDNLVRRLYGKLDTTQGSVAGRGKSWMRGSEKKDARREVKGLRKEARIREEKVVREVLRSRDVVLATCVGAATYSLRDEEFDLVIIDEAAQALEAACWIPILKGRRLVLAGDHKQLAPTVKSRTAEAGLPVSPSPDPPSLSSNYNTAAIKGVGKGGGGDATSGVGDGLGLTMFDRVLRDLGHDVCRMLDVQYRMNRDICDWASTEMYGGLLHAHASVAHRSLRGLPNASAAEDMAAAVMLLVDTTGCDMPEEEAGGGSRRNEREAEVAVQHVKSLLTAGVSESEVAVISPYNGQVNLLKRLLRPEHPGVEVRSVDGFQGGEKEAIVLSLVRSNAGRKVGFLADARRLNVAVTRAKRHVAIVCDAECCGSDAFIGRLIKHVEDRGEYRSALELQPDDADLQIAAPPLPPQERQPLQKERRGKATHAPDESPRAATSNSTPVFTDEDVLARVDGFWRGECVPPPVPATSMMASGGQPQQKGGALGDGSMVTDSEILELPAELTARQRALVHETAERLGLGHASRGEGTLRALVLSRVTDQDVKPVEHAPDEKDGGGMGAGSGGSSAKGREAVESLTTAVNPFAILTESGHNGEVAQESASTLENDSDLIDDGDNGEAESGSSDTNRDESRMKSLETAEKRESVEDKEISRPQRNNQDPVPSSADISTAIVAVSETTSHGSDGLTGQGSNALLASLHADRAARHPPAPAPPSKSSKKKGKKPKKTSANGESDPSSSFRGPDARGFAIDTPEPQTYRLGGAGAGEGATHEDASKTSKSGNKKGKKKGGASGGRGGGSGKGAAGVSMGAGGPTALGTMRGHGKKAKGNAALEAVSGKQGSGEGGVDDDNDDDMAFLDAELKTQRAAEPCYASLLRSTTDAMRRTNPSWAAAQDKVKPSKSKMTGARRGQLEGALQTRLSQEGKKRGKSTGDKSENK